MKKTAEKKNVFFRWAAFALAIICLALATLFRAALIGYLIAGAGCLIMALLGIGLLKKSRPVAARRLRRALMILLGLCFAAFAAVEIPIILSARTDRNPQAEYVIVLGAGVNGTTPSVSLIERLRAVFAYLEAYPDSKAIVSGGQGDGENITEAEAMRIWLERQGISPSRIIKEEASSNTLENIAFSLDIIYALGGDPSGEVAIVSSEYHLFRAKQIASGLGAKPLSVAGKTGNLALRVNYFIREALAVAHMWVFGMDSQVTEAMVWQST